MQEVIREIRESSNNQLYKDLYMRVGIHTGKIVAGIIGSKVVRYDIFGEGVYISKKMESNGLAGKICISEDTKAILGQAPDVINEY